MGPKETTAALNNLTVQVVGRLLGLEMPLTGSIRCPFADHNDSKPSFAVLGGGRRWICYSCGRQGGAIDLVKELRNLPFIEAKCWLSDITGIGAHGRLPQTFRTRIKTSPTPSRFGEAAQAPESPPDFELYDALLARSPLEASGKDYLRGRSLSEATIARFSIGQMPTQAVVHDLVGAYGFARVKAAGLLTQKSTPERLSQIFPRGALLFPYSEMGSTAYLQARLLEGEGRGSRWRNLNHRKRRIFNVDILTQTHIRRVAICEGAIDVMSAAQLGYEAIGLIGVSAQLSKSDLIALRGKQVHLLLDWDSAGEKRARELLQHLASFGIDATRKVRPSTEVTDLNDYLCKVGGGRNACI
jgi:DNA primase